MSILYFWRRCLEEAALHSLHWACRAEWVWAAHLHMEVCTGSYTDTVFRTHAGWYISPACCISLSQCVTCVRPCWDTEVVVVSLWDVTSVRWRTGLLHVQRKFHVIIIPGWAWVCCVLCEHVHSWATEALWAAVSVFMFASGCWCRADQSPPLVVPAVTVESSPHVEVHATASPLTHSAMYVTPPSAGCSLLHTTADCQTAAGGEAAPLHLLLSSLSHQPYCVTYM